MKKTLIALGLVTATLPMMVQAQDGVCEKVVPTKEAAMATFHATYMPSFIPVLVNSEKELNLTAQQCQAFNKFRAEKAPNGKKLIEQIMKLEQEATQAVLSGESKEQILARNAKLAELREKLVKGKLNCQGFVKKQLTDEQYQKLVSEVYPAKMAAAKKRFGL